MAYLQKCFLTCLILLASISYAQKNNKIDSLLTLLKKDKPDTARVTHLNTLGRKLMYTSPDTAIILGNEALSLSKGLQDEKDISISYGNLGCYYYLKADYYIALDYHQKALNTDSNRIKKAQNVSEKNEALQAIAVDLGNIGLVYAQYADYPKALDYYFQALKIGEELGNKIGIASQLCNIGSVYNNQADYPNALNYYFKALKIFEELGDKNSIAATFGQIGLLYMHQGDYSKALDYNSRALEIFEELGNKNFIARVLGNMGVIYKEQKNYPKALEYYLKTLKIREELGAKELIATTLCNLGIVYTKTGKYKEAETYFKKAIALCESIGALDYLNQFEEELSKFYEATGNYQLSLIHYKKAILLKDSIFSEKNKKQITRIEMKYDFEKKEAAVRAEQDKKDLENEAALERKSKTIYMLSAATLLFIGISLAIYLLYRQNKFMNRQRELMIENKLMRAQMDPHFIFNALNSIQKLVLEEKTELTLSYINDFSSILRTTLDNSFYNLIPLEKEIAFIKHYLSLEKLRFNNRFQFAINVSEAVNEYSIKIPPMLIQPVIENAIKHGLSHKTEGIINIDFDIKESRNCLYCSITDTGIGRQKSMELNIQNELMHKSKGMEIIYDRIKLHNFKRKKDFYTIHITDLYDNNNQPIGTKVEYTFPLN